MKRLHAVGFTLAEVLIALALLGIIAAFSIPKVLQSVQSQQRTTTFKETFAVLTEIVLNGQMNGEFTTATYPNYLFSKLNTLKSCTNNAFNDGCWSHAGGIHAAGDERQYTGFILPNGVTVAGIHPAIIPAMLNAQGQLRDGFAVDYNGAQGPNQWGVDQIELVITLGQPGTGTWPTGETYKVPGIFVVAPAIEPNSTALWNTIINAP